MRFSFLDATFSLPPEWPLVRSRWGVQAHVFLAALNSVISFHVHLAILARRCEQCGGANLWEALAKNGKKIDVTVNSLCFVWVHWLFNPERGLTRSKWVLEEICAHGLPGVTKEFQAGPDVSLQCCFCSDARRSVGCSCYDKRDGMTEWE